MLSLEVAKRRDVAKEESSAMGWETIIGVHVVKDDVGVPSPTTLVADVGQRNADDGIGN